MAVDLSPGQALVLLEPNRKQGAEIFKLSLMWLLAQRHLVAREVKAWRNAKVGPGRWRIGRTWTQFTTDRQLPAHAPDDVRAVHRVVAGTPDGYLDQVMLRAQETFGTGLDDLRRKSVLASLLARRLVVLRDEPFLLFFKRSRAALTPGGEITKRQIEHHLQEARRIPDYLDRSPAQAAALAVALGGLILLVPELRSHLAAIAAAVRAHPNGGDSGGSDSTSSSNSGSSGSGGANEPVTSDRVDPGAVPIDDVPGFDFGALENIAFDDIGATLDSIDSSVDAAASDAGGGDGGDGGGGGGGD